MTEDIIKLLGIYFLTWFKFITGPVLGLAAGYTVIETILLTVSGMMSSVVVFSFIGGKIKKFAEKHLTKPKPKFSKKSRAIVKIWNKYGEIGIAALTPILLTPIVGTLIMVSFGIKKKRIFIQMLISAFAWAIFFSLSLEYLMKFDLFKNLFL